MDWIVSNHWKFELCILGIVISVLLPPLWAIIKKRFASSEAEPKDFKAVAATAWSLIAPYAALGLASALTSIVIIAVTGDQITSGQAALLAGYAWDSTLQKLR